MSYNLLRNARVFFTTNVNSDTGAVLTTGFTAVNTQEIQVLDGFSFSQNNTSETVTLNESGSRPTRGQRQFNTALNPVDFSFSTYIRPAESTNALATVGNVTAEERHLWNAMFSKTAITTTAGAGTGGAWEETKPTFTGSGTSASITTAGYATVTLANSQEHQLLKFGLLISFDNTTFVVENCTLDTATIDFGLDAIAMIAWTGKATKLKQTTSAVVITDSTSAFSGGLTGNYNPKISYAPYIANKLSTLVLKEGIDGVTTVTDVLTGSPRSVKDYTLPLTGGSITFSNNVTYLTPANLGIVNQPCTYFTGTRSITGTLNAYLRAGSGSTYLTADLLKDMLDKSTADVDPEHRLTLYIGGASNNTRIEVALPAVVLSIPNVATQQVMSTTINFTAQGSVNTGSTSAGFDITAKNEASIKYWTPTEGTP
jgi:hypothetical protein